MWSYVFKRNARSFAVLRQFNINPANANETLAIDVVTLKRMLDTVQYLAADRPIDHNQYLDEKGNPIR
jgi:hypothetical protein